jgi:ubiquinone/menaquinone biosynthesis C-methylase UbiE
MNIPQFDQIARTVFAPVYPMVAQQILHHTGVTCGCCLDVGCGPGYLSAALAKLTDLHFQFFDLSPEMLEIARRTIEENGLEKRATTVLGDVLSIDLPDESVNLTVSRGAIFFWDAVPQALGEIYRVLSPGGWAYIGGGFGSKSLFDSIAVKMRSYNNGTDHFRNRVRRNLDKKTHDRFQDALRAAGIGSGYVLQNDDVGMWVVMKK